MVVFGRLFASSPRRGVAASILDIYPWRQSLTSILGERGKHRVGRMRDDGEQWASRPARRALSLLPIADGFDRHAKSFREFLLGQARAAAKVTHLRGSSLRRSRISL